MSENNRSKKKSWPLISTFIGAIIIVSFIAPITTHTAYALDVPQQTYPQDLANTTSETDPPLGVPSFSWSAVSGANLYRLQVDSEIGFNQPIFMDISTRNTTYTPSNPEQLFSDGEWYWRVRVEEPTPVGNWSPIFRFTKTWATLENQPALIKPLNGEPLAFFDSPAFSWTPVMGASHYRFQIDDTAFGFDFPLLSYDTLATSYQYNGRLANGEYYWRVVPLDAFNHQGTPSAVNSFIMSYGTYLMDMVPELIYPPDESIQKFTPTFHWKAVQGAQYYRLQYTSAENCTFSGEGILTSQTFYTPTDTLPNDFRYCWRVRVESGSAAGDWSRDEFGEPWHFEKNWDLTPILLTPTHLYQTGLYPFFSWTPVPGAATYFIQIAADPYFNTVVEWANTANTTYASRGNFGGGHFWWRVRPYDGNGREGAFYSVTEEFISSGASLAPIQIYPPYYYQPNIDAEFPMNPVEDRTVALPIFIWHRLMVPGPVGGVYATAYRIQVAETPNFDTIVWDYDTENSSATPVPGDNFIPSTDQDYFWRVCPLNSIDGECLINPGNSLEWWSQIWLAHFSASLGLTPTAGTSPVLLRPEIGQESVEATPLLEWWPLEEADQYQVEVSRDANFSTSEITQTVNIPAYSPVYSLVQRSLGRTDYGTFYWHVRSHTEAGWGGWSDAWRFQIASQSEWRHTRTHGNDENKLLIGHDVVDASLVYDLTTLNASQSQDYWYFGFDAYTATTDLTYAFYIDLDNDVGSGATTPPERGYHVTTNPEHQPEYAIYVDIVAGAINNHNTWVFAWDNIGHHWEFGQRFEDIGGYITQYLGGYIELEIPYAAIGMDEETSSASIMLFSVDISNGELKDTVPSDNIVSANTVLKHFSTVSERMNLVYPPSTVSGDPTTVPSTPPFYWDWPTGDNGASPFAGNVLEVYVDQDYTYPPKASVTIESSNSSYLSTNHITILNDIDGDNIYYWRVRPRYLLPGHPVRFGSWTDGWSYKRVGFTPQNLSVSVTFATPTFSWDMAEGAGSYVLQVATDPSFGNIAFNISTRMTTYTPQATLAQDLYYWRVAFYRSGVDKLGEWSDIEIFDLSLPTPAGLTPDNGQIIHTSPTYCWDPVVGYDGDVPVLTAWKYYLQVSTDPKFSTTYETVETNNHCWTPIFGYHDGTYYWRVAMFDGSGRMSSFSPSATFTKQYPITTLISPISGIVSQTPTFIWTPVNGAATYIFEVSLYPTFSPLYDAVGTINTHYTPTSIYQSEKVYYWRVAIRDRDGRQGPFTDAHILIGLHNSFYLPIIKK